MSLATRVNMSLTTRKLQKIVLFIRHFQILDLWDTSTLEIPGSTPGGRQDIFASLGVNIYSFDFIFGSSSSFSILYQLAKVQPQISCSCFNPEKPLDNREK